MKALDAGKAQVIFARGATAEDVGLAVAHSRGKTLEGGADGAEKAKKPFVFSLPFPQISREGAPQGVKQQGERKAVERERGKDGGENIANEAFRKQKIIQMVGAVPSREKAG